MSNLHNLKISFLDKKWRKKNKHNYTHIISDFDFNKVSVGNFTYGKLDIRIWNSPETSIKIGAFCSIAEGSIFLLSGEHSYKTVSTYPFNTRFNGKKETNHITKGSIIINDDVWIGLRCIILSGVEIGQGAIIGAGSIVASNIPPYSIFAGGKIIKYRFSKSNIDRLMKFNFSKLTEKEIKDNIGLFENENLDLFFGSPLYKNHQR